MYISNLSLSHYRSYSQADIQLGPGVNTMVGYNGMGKTNIVEAINYLAVHQSHRVSSDTPLVSFDQHQAIVRARVHTGERAFSLELEINPGKSNRVAINRGAPEPAKAGLGLLRAVIFAPEDLALINGEPAVRRKFLDEMMVQMRPVLGDARREYDRVLKQRNALLKNAKKSRQWSDEHEATLDVWDEYLAQTGARLLNGRLHVLQFLAGPLNEMYQKIAPGTKVASFSYDSTLTALTGQHVELPSGDEMYTLLKKALGTGRSKDRERGVTLVGPHRDDVVFTLGPAPAKGFASHGETWSFALSIRLASYAVLVADNPEPGARPLLILDDVFAELDAQRREALAEFAHQAEQVIVTAAVAEDLPASMRTQMLRVSMDEGHSQVSVEGTDARE